MRRFVAGLIGFVVPAAVLFGLAVLFAADGTDRLWGILLVVGGVLATVVWWLLVGREDPGTPYVSRGRHLAASLAGAFGVPLVLFGILWLIGADGPVRAVSLVWMAVGAALLILWWRVLGRHPDRGSA
jgi:hypothetical protein